MIYLYTSTRPAWQFRASDRFTHHADGWTTRDGGMIALSPEVMGDG